MKIKSLIPDNEIESGAWDQLKALQKHEFIKDIVVMPDIHQGYEMPIGTVALMDGVISSACVGYDIGCGMSMNILDITKEDIDIECLKNHILKNIPMGFKSLEKRYVYDLAKQINDNPQFIHLQQMALEKSAWQLGTLGGGNHFIELGESKGGAISVTIHSGSRNVGHMIASAFNKLNDEGLPEGYFYTTSDLGKSYINYMNYADNFAFMNRQRMMEIIASDFFPKTKTLLRVNESHNHAIIQESGDVLHRKGATKAEFEVLGVIPINMHDGVYLTRGLGNKEYLESASHGAGRVMSRSKAKKNLSYSDLEHDMKDIITNLSESMLDEAPEAYKNADYVISAQAGVTVDVIGHYKPLMVLKG